jgi:predicted N-acetyltransferase YhbS
MKAEHVRAACPEDLAGAGGWADLSEFTPDQLRTHAADAHWAALEGGRVAAHCSLWWREAPPLPGETVGTLGHYAARDAGASDLVLGRALAELRERGCTLAVGPLDGNTWRRYRFITERGEMPRFFLEPDNPGAWPGYFRRVGFETLGRYWSSLVEGPRSRDGRVEELGRAAEDRGVRLRTLRPEHFEDELRRIYVVSARSFPGNFLYTPLPEAAFLAQYEKLRAVVDPRLVLLAEREGEPVGFVFAVPDALQATRGEAVDRMILKTLAVVPEERRTGLGRLLVGRVQEAAADLGYRAVVHALMHEASHSVAISAHYGRVIRRYELYGLRLGCPRP